MSFKTPNIHLNPVRSHVNCRSPVKHTVPSRSLNRIQPRHYGSSTSSITASSPKKRTWLPISLATAVAVVLGIYIRHERDPNSTTLNPLSFTQYELVSRTPVSSTCSLFSLRPVRPGQNKEVYNEAWKRGIWSVQFKQPQLQIGRDYTPLPPSVIEGSNTTWGTNIDDGTLNFLIRKDPYGEVSGYLHNLKLGATVDIRGPQIEYRLPNNVQDILFIAGGTGIAPALQIAHILTKNRNQKSLPRMHVIWANRRREDCQGGYNDYCTYVPNKWWRKLVPNSLLENKETRNTNIESYSQGFTVKHLENFKIRNSGKITVDYFVDEEGSLINKESISNFITSLEHAEKADVTRRKLVLISGPDGFINFFAGPKMWKNGKETQGPLQGLLSQINIEGWDVWKL